MYFDPGFGSMIIQFVVAGLAGIMAVTAIYRNKIKLFFRKKKDNLDIK